MENIKVEGYTWAPQVGISEEDFISKWGSDEALWPGQTEEKRLANLKLVWQLSNPE